MEALLEIQGLSKSFYTHHLNKEIQPLKDVNVRVEQGDFLGIVGKSGSGKSTIIKCIYRTYLTSQGKIIYHSKAFGPVDLSQIQERKMIYLRKFEIGYVSQFLTIMPRTTSLELVVNSVLETGLDPKKAENMAKETLSHFDLPEELWDSYPNTFSGGEKLRLNIAAAIVKKPRLLLLDEPTASLDQHSKQKVRESIEKLKKEGTTMIGIFHDLEFMEGLTTSVFHMDGKYVERVQ